MKPRASAATQLPQIRQRPARRAREAVRPALHRGRLQRAALLLLLLVWRAPGLVIWRCGHCRTCLACCADRCALTALVPPSLFLNDSLVSFCLCVSVFACSEYYFSTENLIRDVYLRRNMNTEGWVPIKFVAGFNRIRTLTGDLALVVRAVADSQLLELSPPQQPQQADGDYAVRLRENWAKWLLPSVRTLVWLFDW